MTSSKMWSVQWHYFLWILIAAWALRVNNAMTWWAWMANFHHSMNFLLPILVRIDGSFIIDECWSYFFDLFNEGKHPISSFPDFICILGNDFFSYLVPCSNLLHCSLQVKEFALEGWTSQLDARLVIPFLDSFLPGVKNDRNNRKVRNSCGSYRICPAVTSNF